MRRSNVFLIQTREIEAGAEVSPLGRWRTLMRLGRRLLILIAACALASGSVAAEERALGTSVEGLLEYARANPEYAAMRYEADAAAQRVYPAGAFPDPLFRMELQNITNAGSDAPPSLLPSKVGSTKYTLVQPIPFWGKRDLKRDVAEADAEQAQGRVATTWSELAASVKIAYARYYLVVHNERLTREILDLLARLERIALVRYESGLAPQQDVIRAQVERTTMEGELLVQEGERAGVQAMLNSLLARKGAAPFAPPERLRPVPPPVRLDEDALVDRLRSHNPQLFANDARIRAAEKNRELTYRNRYPDFAIGVSPIQMGSRIGEWEVMLEVNIPLQQETRRSQESEAGSMLSAARSQKEAVANRLIGELFENLAGLKSAQRIEILTTTSLLPQSEATLQAALAGYETGKVDFATLLDAQRQIRKSKQDRLKAQAEAQARLAAIERLLGEDL
jgi:cobalt-zinc-cadmium efflux system outer membrane protein